MELRKVIVSGAAGFTGAALVEQLLRREVEVCALVRPNSHHNSRLMSLKGKIKIVPIEPCDYMGLKDMMDHDYDGCFHLMWTGDSSIEQQKSNIDYSMELVRAVKKCGCKRFIATGSQAEYGVVQPKKIIHEEDRTDPITPYGSCKVASCYLTRQLCCDIGMDWIWARIFSLIGRYEPRGRMLPDLYWSLQEGKDFHMSSGRQNWDYLDVHDAAEALIALGEEGHSGEVYHIAHGEYRPLKEYAEELRERFFPDREIRYGDDPEPFISLQPSIEKIGEHTGWAPKRSFLDSVRDYEISPFSWHE